MPLSVEFRDPYCDLIESFCEPEEPLRRIDGLSYVQIYDGDVRGHLEGGGFIDSLAKVLWCDIRESLKFRTRDGKEWAEMSVDQYKEHQ